MTALPIDKRSVARPNQSVNCGYIAVAIISMLQILFPYIIRKLGVTEPLSEGWGVIVKCLRIFFWAIVAILVIFVVFMLISCLWSLTGGMHLLPMR